MRAWTGVAAAMGLSLFAGPGFAAAQEGPGVEIRLAHDSEAEAEAAHELRGLLHDYDLDPWILTRKVLIDERQIPHSDPVLTLNASHNSDETGLLSAFLHEELHWLEKEPWLDSFQAAMREFETIYPEVPSSSEGGARDDESTYRHLLVCDMEYQAMTTLVGQEKARETLAGITHYEWIYDKVLNDPRVRQVALRHGFDVSKGVPGGVAEDLLF